VHQGDHATLARALEAIQQPQPARLEHLLPDHRLQRGEHEEQPQDFADAH
jgi:hypothetical protein